MNPLLVGGRTLVIASWLSYYFKGHSRSSYVTYVVTKMAACKRR